jgi:hypothetical protein
VLCYVRRDQLLDQRPRRLKTSKGLKREGTDNGQRIEVQYLDLGGLEVKECRLRFPIGQGGRG